MTRPLTLAILLLLLLARPVLAVPDVVSVTHEVRNGRQLRIEATVSVGGPGEVRVTGDVNGRAVDLGKSLKRAGPRRVRFKVDARKLGLRSPAEPLVFDLTLRVTEDAGGEATREIERTVPLPLVVLSGLGHELSPGSMEGFVTGLMLATGADYQRGGRRPNLIVHEYESLSTPLDELGADLAKVIRKRVRKSGFSKVDLVGYSMGGLVSRSATTLGAADLVRKLIFLGTPNEGTPIAYVGAVAAQLGVSGEVPGLDPTFADLLLDPAARETLRIFYPTYQWFPPGQELLLILFPDPTPPLAALNAMGPAAGIDYHAISYSAPGTLETLDLNALLPAFVGGVPSADELVTLLETLSTGTGDGVVPLRSVLMTDEPAWTAVINEHDLGDGAHAGLPVDPRVIAEVASILFD